MMLRTLDRVRDWGNRTVKVKWVMPAYLILAIGITGSIWRFDVESRQRAVDQSTALDRETFASQVRDYQSCLSRVASRAEIRGAFIDVYTLPSLEGSAEVIEARRRLDENYPPLNPDDCPVPAGITVTTP